MRTLSELQTWVGREVYDPFDDRIGLVAGLRADEDTGAPEWLAVDTGDGALRAVPVAGAEPSGLAVRVTPTRQRVAASPALPAEDDVPVDADRRIAEHYGLVFDTAASATGIPRRPQAVHEPARPQSPGGDGLGEADRARLVEALRGAHALEQAALEELAAAICEAEDEELVHDLELHHKETSRHAQRLRERLWLLRADRSKPRDNLGKLRALFGARRRGGPRRTPTERARALLDLERREIDAYLALERLAREVGDPATEKLARESRADEEAMLWTLRFGALRFAAS